MSSFVFAEDLHRTIAFRDGTVLRLSFPEQTVPWRRITRDGRIIDEPLPLSQVRRLHLVATPATEQVARIRKMVYELGDKDFHIREGAQKQLLKVGQQFRPILEQSLPRSQDFEINWRLTEILKLLPPGGAVTVNNYDLLSQREGGDEVHGDVGDWTLTANYRGAKVTLRRQEMLSVAEAAPDKKAARSSGMTKIERILRDDDDLFPSNVTRIDFDRGPKGEAISQDANVSEMFTPLGCTFSTSISDSYIAVQSYNVGGRSGGHCAANLEPLYQGVMTIRFCKPGNAGVPAGVRYVGFWTSHIAPEGTALQAFDVSGRRIAEIKTLKERKDFLAIKSSTPIAYIKVVPDIEIDMDYAIDDLVFDRPLLLAEAGDPDYFSLLLTTGERLHGKQIELDDTTLKLNDLSFGIKRLQMPLAEVAIIVPPRRRDRDDGQPRETASTFEHCFVRLVDGSVLRAKGGQGLKLVRFPDIQVAEDNLVALWGSKTDLVEPQAGAWPKTGGILMPFQNAPLSLKQWKLAANWLQSRDLSSDVEFTYANSPVFWAAKPTPRPATSGVARLINGEEIVLSDQMNGFSLRRWTPKEITIVRGEKEWTLPMSEISSLALPGREAG